MPEFEGIEADVFIDFNDLDEIEVHTSTEEWEGEGEVAEVEQALLQGDVSAVSILNVPSDVEPYGPLDEEVLKIPVKYLDSAGNPLLGWASD